MQQATGLARGMAELQSLLLSQLDDYIDIGRAIPSKVTKQPFTGTTSTSHNESTHDSWVTRCEISEDEA